MKIQLPPTPAQVAAMQRKPTRAPMRPPMRGDVFLGRDGEVLTRSNRSNTQSDQFDVPADMIRPGWSLQWVRSSCHGKPDHANISANMENGWRPVPSTDKPGYFHPVEYKGNIERDGLNLMERPAAMTQQAIDDGIKAARQQRRNQSKQFSAVGEMLSEAGSADVYAAPDAMHDHRGVARPMLKRTVEGVPTNLYPHHELAIGDEV